MKTVGLIPSQELVSLIHWMDAARAPELMEPSYSVYQLCPQEQHWLTDATAPWNAFWSDRREDWEAIRGPFTIKESGETLPMPDDHHDAPWNKPEPSRNPEDYPGLLWEPPTVVPLIKTAPPSFSAETEKLVPAEPEWFADRVERRFSVVPLSAEELDHNSRNSKKQLVAQAIPTLRQWANDARNTTATSGNAVAVLNTMLPRLGTFFDRFADLLEAQRIDK